MTYVSVGLRFIPVKRVDEKAAPRLVLDLGEDGRAELGRYSEGRCVVGMDDADDAQVAQVVEGPAHAGCTGLRRDPAAPTIRIDRPTDLRVGRPPAVEGD